MKRIDRAFVINLDRRADRLRSFYEQLPASVSPLVERVSAVEGRALTPTPELYSLFRGNNFQYRRGAIGCALSHYSLWQRIAGDGYSGHATLILEDDAFFSDEGLRFWNERASLAIPPEFHVIYTGGMSLADATLESFQRDGSLPTPEQEPLVREMINPCFGTPHAWFGTFSYILSKPGARLLCGLVERNGIRRAIDGFMYDNWKHMRVYVTVPLVCWSIARYQTDIQNDYITLFDENAAGLRRSTTTDSLTPRFSTF